MQLNALHMRFGAIAAGVILVGVFLLFGGSFGGEMMIQLDFSMYPEVFEGCDVEIDGEIVGRLEPVGRATRNAFKVKKGRHTVRVLHEEMASRSVEITLDKPGEKAHVLLDIESEYSENGASAPTIVLQL